jgi:beta-glucosidase
VRRVTAVNPRTVVAVNAGAPVLMPWADDVMAVLLTWFPGQEFGHALADVLTGRREPSGRLPTSWPAAHEGSPSVEPNDGQLRYSEGLRLGYRGGGERMRYPFGHGLGFGRWHYRELRVDGERALVRIENTGDRAAREVVQLYAERADSSVLRPERWLVGFASATLAVGAAAWVEIAVPPRALAYWDTGAHRFVVEPGAYRLCAGRSSGDLRLTETVQR